MENISWVHITFLGVGIVRAGPEEHRPRERERAAVPAGGVRVGGRAVRRRG